MRLKLCYVCLKVVDLAPPFALCDVTNQYRHLLERIFTLITIDLEDHEPSDDNSSRVLILRLTGYITFPNSIEIMIAAIDIIDDDLNDDPDSENIVVSINFEWSIYDFGRVKGKISVSQIRANLSNDKMDRLVLPFVHHTNNEKF